MKDIVYHGSPNGDITELKPRKSTHQKECIYASDNKTIALLFMGKGKGDLDTEIGFYDGELILVERRLGILKTLYDKPGYLYELDGSTPNILNAIEEEEDRGNIKIYRYPDRPESIPLDNSDLIDKYIRFEKSGLTGAIDDLLEIYPEFKEQVEEKLKE